MRNIVLAVSAALSSIIVAVAPAHAVPSASDLLTGFNALVSGNFTTSSESEGPIVVGGNLSGSGTVQSFGTPLGTDLAGFGSINVYGSAGTAHYNANGLTVKIGGANAGSNFPGAASVQYGATFPQSSASLFGTLATLSTALDGLAATSAPASLPAANSNNAVLTATKATVGGFADVAVIDIAASLLGSYTGLAVNLNGANTVIVNVTGNFTGKPNFMNGAAWRRSVIWNFVDATSVNFGSQGMQGTVLAPFATVRNNNPIDGALFAANYIGTGELHYQPFSGNKDFIDSFGPQPAPLPVPEPASLALLGAGLAGLAAARRLRR